MTAPGFDARGLVASRRPGKGGYGGEILAGSGA